MADYVYSDIKKIYKEQDDLKEWFIIGASVLLGLVVILFVLTIGLCCWVSRLQKRLKDTNFGQFKIRRPKLISKGRTTDLQSYQQNSASTKPSNSFNESYFSNKSPNNAPNSIKNPLSNRSSSLDNDNFLFASSTNQLYRN